MAITSNEFYEELNKLIDLPPETTDIHIHVPLDGAVTVECTYFANMGTVLTAVPITKTFTLVEKMDEDNS